MRLKTIKSWFIDEEGRKILLRGVNLGGSSKLPYKNGATNIKTDFSDHLDVSFVDRPFPLDEADEHFERLRSWGFNTLRLLTTWEAIEHQGPGIYDEEYLTYFTKIVEKAGEYGFYVIIDPHQDVWSRMTGGDGAPGWCFDKLGMDISKLSASDAALTMQYHYPEDYPQMHWAMNYYRFATATMFTLFFAGNDFAPNTMIEGVPVQDYLQSHFINSIAEIAKRVKNMDNVLGFGPLNEPGSGYIGIKDLTQPSDGTILGKAPTPYETIIAASGKSIEVPYNKIGRFGVKKDGTRTFNPEGISIWERECIWKKEGVWDGNNKILKADHFAIKNGESINFFRDYLRPFSIDYITKIREEIPDSLLFLEGEPLAGDGIHWEKDDPKDVVNAGHWYDVATLITKNYRSWLTIDVKGEKLVFFKKRVRQVFKDQLQGIKSQSNNIFDGVPTLIGEFGIPYDMNGKKSFKSGNYKKHVDALTLYYELLDELQLHSTQWNYTADNNNEWGDLWNMEDLSIFSRDQQTDPDDINSGSRALEGFSRPYPMKTTGTPIKYNFRGTRTRKIFEFSYHNDPSLETSTQIYVPKHQFPHGPGVLVLGAEYHWEDQILHLKSSKKGIIKLTIKNNLVIP